MERLRKPFEGVTNIVRFNWHFYLLSALLVLLLLIINSISGSQYSLYTDILSLLIIVGIITSLIVSFYVYDLSNLYSFSWLNKVKFDASNIIVNLHAGFDETSSILKSIYPNAELIIFDFYDPKKHTEVSIKRARKAYPLFAGTQHTSTSALPLQNNYADIMYIILSAHEIRNGKERISFFKEISRVMKKSGKIITIEHLRDFPNFLAFNIGFFHFLSKSLWHRTFKNADLKICNEIKITPFITIFILEKDGAAS